MDDPNVLLVKAPEGVLDDVLWVSSLQPLSKHGEEHGEVDWTRRLVHHVLQVLVTGVLAKTGQHIVQVLLVYEAVPDHIERGEVRIKMILNNGDSHLL